MSDFLKKCEEIEAKLKKVAAEGNTSSISKAAAKQPSVVVNHLTIEQAEDNKRAQALASRLMGMMAGPVKRQPTDQELFGHLVPTEEQIKKAEEQWGDGINSFFREVTKPVEKAQKLDFGRRGPIREEDLTEEEQRIRKIGVDPRLTEGD